MLLFIFISLTNTDEKNINFVMVLFTASLFLLFAIIFFNIGYKALKGKAKDTLGNGIVSVLFSLVGFYSFLGQRSMGVAEQIGHLIVPVFLLIAGILAIVGRKDYKKSILENKDD